jgi:hypothetical protein
MSLDIRMATLRRLTRELDDLRARIAHAKATLASTLKRTDATRIRVHAENVARLLRIEASMMAEFVSTSEGLRLGIPAEPDRSMRMADCHEDRKHYARGLCRACYQTDFYTRRALRELEARTPKGTPST